MDIVLTLSDSLLQPYRCRSQDPLRLKPDPKPKNETVGKLKAAAGICSSGRARRRRYAEEGAQRRADRLRLTTDRRRQEGQRSLPGDGSISTGRISVEASP